MRSVLIVLLLAGSATPAMATIFNVGTVVGASSVALGAATDGFTTGPSSTGVAGTIGSVSFGSLQDGPYRAAVSHNVQATWASADAGTFGVAWGWQVVSAGSGLLTQVNTNVATADWLYSFTATGNGTFSGNYRIVGQGNTFGLQPLYGTGDLPFGPYGGTVPDPTGSGTFSVGLVNGQTYTMRFYNFGNLGNNSGFDADGSASATVDWKITYANGGVPEPASWAMLITGFGLVGGAARRLRMVAV
jgi:hypothetical protein